MKRAFLPGLRYAIAGCVVFSIAAIALFAGLAVATRKEIPMSLEDVRGDTSGIHALTVSGSIINNIWTYAYDFRISPQGADTDMRVFNSKEDLPTYPWFFPNRFDAEYIPVGPTRTETADSTTRYILREAGGETVYFEEERIYADQFRVIPKMDIGIPIWLEPLEENSLYYATEEYSYIYRTIYEDNRQDPYTPGFQLSGSGRLNSHLRIGDTSLLVPMGKGFYGHTALYRIDAPGGQLPLVQKEGSYDGYAVAEELYPIKLTRDEDEILGLIEVENGAILAIRHRRGFELVRVNLETGSIESVTADGRPSLGLNLFSNQTSKNVILTDNALILSNQTGDYHDNFPEVWIFDLSGGGLRLASHIQAADLWENRSDGIKYGIVGAVWKDDVLYTAAYTDSESGGTSPGTVCLSATAADGTLIGRCRLRCGIEQDYRALNPDGSLVAGSFRVLDSITLE